MCRFCEVSLLEQSVKSVISLLSAASEKFPQHSSANTKVRESVV